MVVGGVWLVCKPTLVFIFRPSVGLNKNGVSYFWLPISIVGTPDWYFRVLYLLGICFGTEKMLALYHASSSLTYLLTIVFMRKNIYITDKASTCLVKFQEMVNV